MNRYFFFSFEQKNLEIHFSTQIIGKFIYEIVWAMCHQLSTYFGHTYWIKKHAYFESIQCTMINYKKIFHNLSDQVLNTFNKK